VEGHYGTNERERSQAPYKLFRDRLFGKGKADWHLIDLEHAPYEELMKIMSACKHGEGETYPEATAEVVTILSREFFRRRSAGR